jgi:hypothetical protein
MLLPVVITVSERDLTVAVPRLHCRFRTAMMCAAGAAHHPLVGQAGHDAAGGVSVNDPRM